MSMLNKMSVTDVDVTGKKCLVRVDFNVPMKDGKITDENRINGALPTIKYLIDHKAKVILCSHMGKPKGQVVAKYSLKPVAERLSEILGQKVTFATDVIGPSADAAVANVKDGEVVLFDGSPMFLNRIEIRHDADSLREGQLTLTAQYGVLTARAKMPAQIPVNKSTILFAKEEKLNGKN